MLRFGAIMLGVSLVLLGSARAEATKNATGPVRIATGDEIVCIAVNAGSGSIAHLDVVIRFQAGDGSFNGLTETTCGGPIEPGAGCPLYTSFSAGATVAFGFCEVTFPTGKVRGTLCNLTKGLCSDTR